jgi:hypothetical protein
MYRRLLIFSSSSIRKNLSFCERCGALQHFKHWLSLKFSTWSKRKCHVEVIDLFSSALSSPILMLPVEQTLLKHTTVIKVESKGFAFLRLPRQIFHRTLRNCHLFRRARCAFGACCALLRLVCTPFHRMTDGSLFYHMFTNNIDHNLNNMNNLLLQHGSPDGDDDDDIPFHQLVCSGDEDDSLLDLMMVVRASNRSDRIFQIVDHRRNNMWQKHLLLCRHRGDFVNKYHMTEESFHA